MSIQQRRRSYRLIKRHLMLFRNTKQNENGVIITFTVDNNELISVLKVYAAWHVKAANEKKVLRCAITN